MTASKPTILILMTQTGGGHLNLAQSLKGMLEPRYEVVLVNGQPESYGRFFTAVSRHFSQFLTWQYILTDNELASYGLHKVLARLSCKRLDSILRQVRPQLIITTHALLACAITRANERQPQQVPLVFQLTDLGQLHMSWFTEKRADAYLAPTREIFAQAQAQGIAQQRLHLTGRPVRCQFWETSPALKRKMLTALDFDPDRFTIFLQGGAKGSVDADRAIEGLLEMSVPIQIILAVGNNRRMAARYAGIERVRVVPFTQEIASYMAAADVIAGKAGASFISEAWMLEKPFLVTSYIPGQETANLQFIKRHKLGWVCLEKATQQDLLTRIVSNPALISEMVDGIRAYKAWNRKVSQDIPSIIEQLLP